MKSWSSLTQKDLARRRTAFLKELGALYPSLEFSLDPEPAGDLVADISLSFRGRALGRLSATLREGAEEPCKGAVRLLDGVVASLLDKLWLRKCLTLDRESGLFNKDYLLSRLRKLLRPLDTHPRPLRLEEGGGAINLALIEFRYEWGLPQRVLLGKLKSVPGLLLLARHAERRFAMLFRGSREDARQALDYARREAQFRFHSSPPQIGFASYPGDLAFDGLGSDPSDALLQKAASALFFASSQNPSQVIAFGDLLNCHGRVTQVLPQDRAILNLGRSMGALAGQVFLVKGEDGAPKGEASVFETAPTYSIAHLLNSAPGRRIAQGDRLEFLRLQEGLNPQGRNGGQGRWAGRDKALAFIAQNAVPERNFLFALARPDDYERLSAMVGDLEAEKPLDHFAIALAERVEPKPDVSVPWEPGALALAWAEPPRDLQERLLAFLKGGEGPGKVSLGLVSWPSAVLTPESVPQAAKKALLEAAMTGHEVAVAFGPQTLNISGDRLFDEGDMDEAVEEYRKGLILDPAHINLLNSLGVCYGRIGDQKAAIGAFDEILRLDPDNLMANFNKGCSYILSGKHEEAEKSLEKAASLDPSNFEVLYQLGKISLELGHVPKALQALGKAAGLKGRRGPVHSLLGQARLLSGDAKGAMDSFKQAVKYNPDDAQSLSSLGVLYLEGDKDKQMALSLLRRSVELDPSNSLYRQRLGKLYYDMGMFQEAEHHLKSALEYSRLNPSPELSGNLAMLAAALGKERPREEGAQEPAQEPAQETTEDTAQEPSQEPAATQEGGEA
ncbi:MAG: tetratricopeptide repeat protein [Deltaproteobacteria bacterium]|jgi:tetratricopeptide (TPR) repeat protein|nr:tetratricopeptide repeat protein [Deltaproteobacteria bacterium]